MHSPCKSGKGDLSQRRSLSAIASATAEERREKLNSTTFHWGHHMKTNNIIGVFLTICLIASIYFLTSCSGTCQDQAAKAVESSSGSPIIAKDKNSPTDSSWIFPDSDKRKLTKEELRPYSYSPKGDLAHYGRNEIFARRGYIFKSNVYLDYFLKKTWNRA